MYSYAIAEGRNIPAKVLNFSDQNIVNRQHMIKILYVIAWCYTTVQKKPSMSVLVNMYLAFYLLNAVIQSRPSFIYWATPMKRVDVDDTRGELKMEGGLAVYCFYFFIA